MIDTIAVPILAVADTTQPWVSVLVNLGDDGRLPDGRNLFQAGDNITLLSLGVSFNSAIPIATLDTSNNNFGSYQFFRFAVRVGPDIWGDYPQYDSSIPFAPYEYSIGQFITTPKTSNFSISLEFLKPTATIRPVALMALAGVPACYNGMRLTGELFAKIEHTLPMVSI